MANKHKYDSLKWTNTHQKYPLMHKVCFLVTDEDYPYYYEAMKVQPGLGYYDLHYTEGDTSCLEFYLEMHEEYWHWEECFLKKVEEFRRKAKL